MIPILVPDIGEIVDAYSFDANFWNTSPRLTDQLRSGLLDSYVRISIFQSLLALLLYYSSVIFHLFNFSHSSMICFNVLIPKLHFLFFCSQYLYILFYVFASNICHQSLVFSKYFNLLLYLHFLLYFVSRIFYFRFLLFLLH